jgi:hypothetical protein
MNESEVFFDGDPLAFNFGPGGWMRVNFPELAEHLPNAPTVLAKTVERGGRRVITRLIVAADPVDSTVVKALPTGRLESLANVPWFRDLLAQTDAKADPLAEALEAALSGQHFGMPGGPVERRPRGPLHRPDGSDPDGFYGDVAVAYNEALERTSAPATVLATEAGVPVPTVRRWIAEARRRGLLGPGRKGRAG